MEYYASVCRLCESPDRTGNSWVELFSNKNEHLLTKIRTCANIVIDDKDGLPKRICGRCHQTVEQAYNFRMQCEITDAKLRYELDFLSKHGENRGVPIPPFDYGRFLSAHDGETIKPDVILRAEKVYIKTEPDEDAVFCATKVETQLKDDDSLVRDPKDHGDETETSEASDIEDESSTVEKKEPPKKLPNQHVVDEQKEVTCDICEAHFDTRQKWRDHRKAEHPNHKHQYQCKECPKTFSRALYLEEHRVQHTGIRPFECPQCDRKYFTPSGLRCHMQDHSENLPYVCDQCGKGFYTESKLRIHYTNHIEVRNYICVVCNKGYKSVSVLNKHKLTHLPRDQKPKQKPRKKKDYICQYCGKVSTHPSIHKMHLKTHTGDQPFECHVCLRRFTSYGSHKKHLLVHTGEKPHVCQYCQKAFRQKHHMHTHIRGVHTKEKPYQCKFCPRAFATLGNMREHEKSHVEPGGKKERLAALSSMVDPSVGIPLEFGHFMAVSTEHSNSF